MANELVLVYRLEEPIPFTVANGTGIEKGALLSMTDPMTAVAPTAEYANIAGVAASEKVANDGKTSLGIYRRGIFKAVCSGAIVVGMPLASAQDASGGFANYVGVAAATVCSGSKTLGYALETGAAGESILIELNIGCGAAL